MTVKYFYYTFAQAGDLATIPDPTQPDGSLSYHQGFPTDYSLNYSDPSSKNIPRDQFNQLMNDVTGAIQQIQQNGFPTFITTAMNDGTPFPYAKNACVFQPTDGNNYQSLINSNTDTPPSSNWLLINFSTPLPTGIQLVFLGAAPPSGWVWANGQTIGNASSNGTQRANADTATLFNILWALPSTTIQLYNSSGGTVSRGVSAASDYAANCAVATPDTRERACYGLGTMGGTSDPNRITITGSGISGSVLAAAGGVESVTLSNNNVPAHRHYLFSPVSTPTSGDIVGNPTYAASYRWSYGSATGPELYNIAVVAGNPADASVGLSSSVGSGQAFTTLSPTILCNKIIKL